MSGSYTQDSLLTLEKNHYETGSMDSINHSLSNEEKIKLYRDMLRIRRFEEQCIRSYQKGHIGGFCHTYIGQEAVAIGSISVLGPEDHIISAYRIHGHAIAVGMPMNELMAELYGKETGCSKGKGGSMHFLDPKRHFWGGHGIVGGQTPLGAGIAFAIKYKNLNGACLCYLGDGAVNQGVFYESLNLASLWKLPVIYIIENNGFSMGTSQKRSSAGEPISKRAEGFDIAWSNVEGYDLYEVRSATYKALQKAYQKSLPHVLEVHTYRYRGHSMSDPDQTYRTKEDIKTYREKYDPIEHYQNKLIKENVLTNELAKKIDQETILEAGEAAAFAEKSPFPKPESIQQHVYWETDNPEHKQSQGTLFFNSINKNHSEL